MSYPVLYILMRSDMTSLNPGKMAAQASHAANQFTFEMDRHFEDSRRESDSPFAPQDVETYAEWLGERGFGTVIVLDCHTEQKLDLAINESIADGYAAGMVFDPTYPVRDGEVTHLIPVITCGYVFVPNKDEQPRNLRDFNLHK